MTTLQGRALLTTGAGLYLLLHYVVVCWLIFHLLSGIGALSAELVTVGAVTVRLWWLVAALIIAVALGTYAAAITDLRDEPELLVVVGALAHLPAVFGAWGLVWTGLFGEGWTQFGHVIADLLWSVLFLLLIVGSCLAITGVLVKWAEDRAERPAWQR
ncbi:MAG TPA: hypothetical protein VGL02_16350 [Streptomyces sp.]